MPDPLSILFAAVVAFVPQHDGVAAPPVDPNADPVLATVGARSLHLSDLVDEVNRQIPLNFYHRRVPAEKMAEFRRTAFDALVEKQLIHLDAVTTGLTASEAELNAEFEAALREAGDAYVRMEGAARTALFEEVRPTLTRRTLIRKSEQRLAARVPKPTAAAVRAVYDERIRADDTAFLAQKEARFFHIFVAVDPSRIRLDEAAKKQRIESALAELQQGKPFADVARAYSEDEYASAGGDLGYQQSGSFRLKAVNDEAFALQKGQTSPILRSLHGFHILYCDDVKPQVRMSFEAMQPAIEQWLHEEHLAAARARWLLDLRQQHPVVLLRPDLLAAPGDAAAPTPAAAPPGTSAPAPRGGHDK